MGEPQEEIREYLFKVLVVGEMGTGKTSIIKRFVHNIFSMHYKTTIGVDFALKVINWDPHTVVRLQLWDIAGQERHGNMTRVYYKEAVAAMLVYDVTRPTTFEAVSKWKSDIDAKVRLGNTSDGPPIPVVLLANKCDMAKQGLERSEEQMEQFCKDQGFVGWFETSAKDNINIDKSSKFLVSKILENEPSSEPKRDENTITITRPPTDNPDGGAKPSCC